MMNRGIFIFPLPFSLFPFVFLRVISWIKILQNPGVCYWNRFRYIIAWGGALGGIAVIGLRAGKPAPPVAPPADAPILLEADATKEIGPIHPEIYGLAQPTPEHFAQLNLKLWRWGGNSTSRYNWERGNAWNAARDWQFRNGNYNNTTPEDKQPSGVVDKAVTAAKAAHCETLLTIPTLGWVARNDDNAAQSVGVPDRGGAPLVPGSQAIAGYDPAANRHQVSVKSWPRKGRPFADPPDLADDVVYQDEWINHLVRKFGKANSGGVRYYAMDNEPDLWDGTHTDMHPVRPDYDEIFTQFTEYADAIKDVDPTAQITGPVSWGWTGYFFSPRDRGEDNFAAHADRKKHDDLPFLEWFLRETAAHDKKTGRRSLDVLDVHFYPQANGVYGGATDSATNDLRLRSVKALYDPNYKDESWIGAPVQLIPRLRQWVDKNYPGTKIGLTEWNWGADNTLNGGLTVAEVLGVFGRERLDMACYWTAPGNGTPGFYAYKMYRNADGANHGFGDTAVSAHSSAPDRVSCYASLESKTGLPVILIINKTGRQIMNAPLHIVSRKAISKWQTYRYDGANLKEIIHLPDMTVREGRTEITLPPDSMTLLRGM